eukprot:SAG31_NODE_45956_length_256_cov_1.076433_1_plen_53_part_10
MHTNSRCANRPKADSDSGQDLRWNAASSHLVVKGGASVSFLIPAVSTKYAGAP